jgi:hypothetical protein
MDTDHIYENAKTWALRVSDLHLPELRNPGCSPEGTSTYSITMLPPARRLEDRHHG